MVNLQEPQGFPGPSLCGRGFTFLFGHAAAAVITGGRQTLPRPEALAAHPEGSCRAPCAPQAARPPELWVSSREELSFLLNNHS